MRPIRVLLVDDHAVVRMGYRTLLEGYPEIAVVGEAASGEAACSLYQELSPDVVIMDLALPGIGGLEAIRRILLRDPQARVLVFSMYEDPGFVEQALRAGAGGYIPKSSVSNDEMLNEHGSVIEGMNALARIIAVFDGFHPSYARFLPLENPPSVWCRSATEKNAGWVRRAWPSRLNSVMSLTRVVTQQWAVTNPDSVGSRL